ncbi:MAG TPA: hypothetical protein VJ302_26925 [Blastocatellia bacterium]|nr:hypothetical protein [Blastocatellia bacterium]
METIEKYQHSQSEQEIVGHLEELGFVEVGLPAASAIRVFLNPAFADPAGEAEAGKINRDDFV